MMKQMSISSPSAWEFLKKRSSNPTPNPSPNPSPDPSPEPPPSWCKCGGCKDMPKQRENVCCKNDERNHEHPDFHLIVLDDTVLGVAMKNNSDLWYYTFDVNNNACWRFTAYRQYIMWHWGKLGYGNRKVIPSCVVRKIREKFPDPNNNYTGFLDTEFTL